LSLPSLEVVPAWPAGPHDEEFRDPDLFINREISLLDFNRRVLALARDPSIPLLERLRFLTISGTNLDEFFEIRVAGLLQQLEHGVARVGPDGLDASEQLGRIEVEVRTLVDRAYTELNDVLLPALREEGVWVLRRQEWTPQQRAWAREVFADQVLPVLTPIGLDPAHPFPRVLNKALSFIVSVEGRDAFSRQTRVAIVQVPRALPRVLAVPRELATAEHCFTLLSSIVHEHVADLFPGMRVTGCHQFRVTRNSDLFVDEEEADDLLHAIEDELLSRRYGDAVRLELASDCPEGVAEFLREQFELSHSDVFRVDGPVNVHRLDALHGLVPRPDLRFVRFRGGAPTTLSRGVNVFDALREQDVLLHHPYESFAPVLEMLNQAASDPAVLAVKQTLYRVGRDSPVVDGLVRAAEAGKEVTAVIELRARFDEARNIEMANRLANAGANVVYGVVGYKCHAKMLMIVRREADGLRRYCHLGTGNYHVGTVRAYTDLSLLTANPEIGDDMHELFLQVTGLGARAVTRHLLHAPFTLHDGILERIDREAEHARAGLPARIRARMNSLSDPRVIRALYAASSDGVRIDLLVRGICCLRPGVPGVSENIRVRSVLGRFLEHSRVYVFHNAGDTEVYGASADWMQRNLYRRIEVAFPVLDPDLAARVSSELDLYFACPRRGWSLGPDSEWTALDQAAEGREAQLELLARLSDVGDA
jgi:polyphosphate kinase